VTTLVWFRNDLRIDDHEPLLQASKDGPVAAVYVLDPRGFAPTKDGRARISAHRARFLIESLIGLGEQLRAVGGDLIVRSGHPEQVLPALAREVGARTLRFHREPGTEETAVEAALARALTPDGVTIRTSWGSSLHHPDDLPFALAALPDVFTRFRERVERDAPEPRVVLPAPARITTAQAPSEPMPTLASFGLSPTKADPRATMAFRGGVIAGRERMQHYVWTADRLKVYKQTRNGMLNPDDASRLSPWLALGCLSPREVYADVKRYERERVRNDSTYWLVFELLWRDYFRLLSLKFGARLYRVDGIRRLRIPWRQPDRETAALHDFEAWRDGLTGFPLVDANMRELSATGYMSNRGRQNVASFLTKNLGIDWRWGAHWFESQLLDYDTASNYGNWCYTAGVGNDPRGFRFFNIHKQANDYDPDGAYVRHWLPELRGIRGGLAHRPEQLDEAAQRRAGLTLGRDYPKPMLDLFESARRNEAIYNRAPG
jgi:deoxyribodipyrimidine photo-lyase